MITGWCVRVLVFDDLVVSISERELCGRDLSAADTDLIRACAQQLLSFAGPPSSPCGTESVEDPTSAPRAPESEALSDPTCDNDVGRCCADLWPTSPTSWCEGCLHRAASALSEVGRLQQGLRALLVKWAEQIKHEEWTDADDAMTSMWLFHKQVEALLAAPDAEHTMPDRTGGDAPEVSTTAAADANHQSGSLGHLDATQGENPTTAPDRLEQGLRALQIEWQAIGDADYDHNDYRDAMGECAKALAALLAAPRGSTTRSRRRQSATGDAGREGVDAEKQAHSSSS